MLRAASSVSAFTLLSRVFGLVRDMLMFRVLGAGWASGAFVLAWTIPNLLRRLLGEGALSASFLPAFASSLERDGKGPARALLATVSGHLIRWLAILTVIVWLACLVVPPGWIGHDDPKTGATALESGRLLVTLIALLFPYVLLICLAAIYTGALNSLDVFGRPAALPIILNIFWIAGLLLAKAAFPDDGPLITKVLSAFLIAGGVVQLGLVALMLHRRDFLPRPRLPLPGDPAHAVFRNMLPTLIGMSIVQVNVLVDQGLAYYLVDPGANSYIYLANRLMLFPHALTSLALATVVFPQFAKLASRNSHDELRRHLGSAQHTALFLSVPASVGLMLIARDFVEVFFAHGHFTSQDAIVTGDTTLCLVAGLPFLGAAQMYTRTLYALGDLSTPARIGALLLPVNIALNLIFLLVFDLGVPGLTLATSLCAVMNMLALGARLQMLCPGRAFAMSSILRTLAATAAMAAAVIATRAPFAPTSHTQIGLLRLLLPMAVGGIVYLAVHLLLRSPELQRLRRR